MNLSKTEVANLFLGIKKSNSGLTPFDQRDQKLRGNFYREVTGLSLASIRAKRAKQVFTGRGRPPVMLPLKDIPRILSKNSGAVTYAPADQLPENSKVLLILKSGVQK